MTNKKTIELIRQFDCPVNIVFDAIKQGLLFKSTVIKEEGFVHNFSEGGTYKLEWKSGGRCSGKYLQIIPNQLVKFTWKSEDCKAATSDNTTVTVSLISNNNGCQLKLVHDGLDDGFCYEDHLAGWTSSLEDFGPLLTGQAAIN